MIFSILIKASTYLIRHFVSISFLACGTLTLTSLYDPILVLLCYIKSPVNVNKKQVYCVCVRYTIVADYVEFVFLTILWWWFWAVLIKLHTYVYNAESTKQGYIVIDHQLRWHIVRLHKETWYSIKSSILILEYNKKKNSFQSESVAHHKSHLSTQNCTVYCTVVDVLGTMATH